MHSMSWFAMVGQCQAALALRSKITTRWRISSMISLPCWTLRGACVCNGPGWHWRLGWRSCCPPPPQSFLSLSSPRLLLPPRLISPPSSPPISSLCPPPFHVCSSPRGRLSKSAHFHSACRWPAVLSTIVLLVVLLVRLVLLVLLVPLNAGHPPYDEVSTWCLLLPILISASASTSTSILVTILILIREQHDNTRMHTRAPHRLTPWLTAGAGRVQ